MSKGLGVRGGFMVNGKAPLYATVILLALLAALALVVQPYSADWPGTTYTDPARRYIRAAMRHDSAGLDRLSASLYPVRWALGAARRHPDTLALWGRWIQVWTGETRGDTTEVFVYPSGEACDTAPLVLRFVGSGRAIKVVEAGSACIDPG